LSLKRKEAGMALFMRKIVYKNDHNELR